MKSSIAVLSVLALVALVLLPQNAMSMKCFICNNVDNPSGCGHGKDVSDEFLKDCNDQGPIEGGVSGARYSLCRKIVTKIEFNVNNNTETERITRKCGYLESKYDDTCYYRGGFGGRQWTCSCKDDGCNSGVTFGTSKVIIALGALATFFWKLL